MSVIGIHTCFGACITVGEIVYINQNQNRAKDGALRDSTGQVADFYESREGKDISKFKIF